jgi:basic membrane protein A and related proteins
MRKRFLLLIAAVAAMSLLAAACGDDGESSSSSTGATASGSTSACPTSAEKGDPNGKKVGLLFDLAGRGDQSFNDSAACGLDRAAKDFKIAPSESVQAKEGDRAERAKAMASKNEMVAAVGFLWATPIEDAAKASPNVKFAIVDSVVAQPNVYSVTFAEEQGSYLVGAAAALQTKSKKVGFIGGVENDLIKKFAAGYVAGAKAANSAVTVDVKYITPDGDFSGFTAPDKAKVIADKMYSDGIDIIYAAAGTSGGGMFEAAKAYTDKNGASKKVWGIGVDSDQYNTVGKDLQPYVLTSMLKRVDVAIYKSIEAYTKGTFAGGKADVFDLKADGVGYATSGGFLTADTIKKIDGYKADIIAGKITVPTKP